MKENHLIRKLTLILLILLSTVSLKSAPVLNAADAQYITKTLATEISTAVQNISHLVGGFIDPKDKRPLSSYIQDIQQQTQLIKRIIKELKAKRKNATPALYRQAIEQTLDILNNLNDNLLTPIYKCLVGKRTTTLLNIEDKADLLAAALKISIDKFHASSSQTLLSQLKALHAHLNGLDLTNVAHTIEYVLDLLETAEKNRKHSLTDEEKKAIKQAILLKLQLNKN